jgi:hypothetical protein
MVNKLLFFCVYFALGILNTNAQSSFLVRPSGQADYSSCQSYALAVALAFKQDPVFPIKTAADLRKAETSIRTEIKKAAGSNRVSHDHIGSGFLAYTKNLYELKITSVSEPELGDQIGERTGVKSKASAPPEFLFGMVVKDVVLTSTTKIGAYPYEDGHIVAVLGVDGPPNSSRSYLLLNSGVKVKDKTQKTCSEEIPDDPGPYTALLSWVPTSEVSFKSFGGSLKLWRVEKRK